MNFQKLLACVMNTLLGMNCGVLAVIGGLSSVGLTPGALRPARAYEPQTLALGATAPDFKLPGTDGREHSLSDFANAKILMVVFTCNHCPTAQAYEQRVIDLHRDYADRGVAVVAISPNDPLAVRLDELGYSDLNDSLEDMKIRAQQRGFEFPYLYDGDSQQTSQAYGPLATPHVFLFDAERKLRYQGRIDNSDIKVPTAHDARNALDELLAGKPVSVPQTRVFGCSTKWSDKRKQATDSLAKWNEETAEVTVIAAEDLRQQLTGPSKNYRLVNIWATWCGPCVGEMDELVEMLRMYRKRDFELITVSVDDPALKDKVLQVLQSKHCSARNYIVDVENQDEMFDAVDRQWQGAVPYSLLIAPSGKVLHRVHGEFDPLKLKGVIVDNLGRTYAPRETTR